jgi:predicted dehydrogenase/nucleoside-diphosphate-sugar epimerase
MPRTSPQVAFVGTGYIADWHARALRRDRITLAAVCDRDRQRAEDFARRFRVPQVFGSLDEMLAAHHIDAVHVLTPPNQHFAVASRTIEAGIPTLVEKPLAASVAECDALTELADRHGVRLGVSHNYLFHPIFEALDRDLKAGLFGKIDYVAIHWNKELPQLSSGPFESWLFEQPQNVLLEVAPHSVSQMLHLVGTPDEMTARAGNSIELSPDRPFYRRWQIDATCGKVCVELRFSFVRGFADHRIHVRGSHGAATADIERFTYVVDRHGTLSEDFDRHAVAMAHGRQLRRQARGNFVRQVLAKAGLPVRGNLYAESIRLAIRAFYDDEKQSVDARLASRLGMEVVAKCVQAGQIAGVQLYPPARPQVNRALDPKILVLGATGFIGREVVRQLTAQGHAVRALVRSPRSLEHGIDAERIEIIRGDLSRAADLEPALDGIECVYHLARPHVKTWQEYQQLEIEVTRNVAEACIAHRVRRLIYTGTIDSYYAGKAAGLITEETSLDPRIDDRNLYARAKAASEEILMALHRERGLPVVILRPGIVVGRGGTPFHGGIGRWSFATTCQIWGRGDTALPIVLVQDVAAALVAAFAPPGLEGESFNLVGDCRLTAREYLEELERCGSLQLHKRPTPISKFYVLELLKFLAKCLIAYPDRRWPAFRDWESRTQRARFDCTKARGPLGWKPAAQREEIIRLGIHEPMLEYLS